MGARGERGVELAERGQDRPGLDDRVDALLWPRAVGGATADLDLDPHEALVGDDQLELGRLGHDRRVGADGGQHLLHAEARVLLVGHGGDHDVAGQAGGGDLAAREQRRREPGLHVIGAAAVQPVAVEPRRVRVGHALDPDRVEVRAQQQRAPAAGAGGRGPRTLGRPGVASSTSACRPAPRAQSATKRAISASPAPPGTSAGLTESIATSREVSSMKSACMGAERAVCAAPARRLSSGDGTAAFASSDQYGREPIGGDVPTMVGVTISGTHGIGEGGK